MNLSPCWSGPHTLSSALLADILEVSKSALGGGKKAICITVIQLLDTYCFSQAALHTSIITIVNSLHSPLALSGESVLYASPQLHVDQGLVPAVESCPSGHTFSAKRTAHVGLVHGFQKAGFAEGVCAGQSDRLQEYVQTDRTKTVWTFKTPGAFFNGTRVHFRHRRHSAAGLSGSINDDSLSLSFYCSIWQPAERQNNNWKVDLKHSIITQKCTTLDPGFPPPAKYSRFCMEKIYKTCGVFMGL